MAQKPDRICEHTCEIMKIQEVVENTIAMMALAYERLQYLVEILRTKITQLDFVVQGRRTTSLTCTNFLLAITMMYLGYWKEAMNVLSKVSPSPVLQDIISRYYYISILVVAFMEYKKNPHGEAEDSAEASCSKERGDKIRREHCSSIAIERLAPRSIYNKNVDMSTYGPDLLRDPFADKLLSRLEIEGLEIEFFSEKLTIYNRTTSEKTSHWYKQGLARGAFVFMDNALEQHWAQSSIKRNEDWSFTSFETFLEYFNSVIYKDE